MSTYSPKTYSTIITDMQNYIIGHQDVITDFNEGSVIKSFCDAVALEIEQVYLRAKIGFIKYLPDLPFYAFGFTKIAGIKAAGEVVFSRNVATADSVTIEIGTIVGTPSGLLYVTTEEGTIASMGTDSNSCTIEAQDVGDDYNVPAASITVLTTSVVGVDTVTNAAATTSGADEESDEDFKARFREYILGLGKGSVYGYITCAKSVTGVRSASVVEHFPPEDDMNVSLYIDDGAGNASAELIAAVEDVLNGDGTATNPGYRAAGINVEVLEPTKVTIDVTMEITDTGIVSQTAISENVENAISDYINNLQLGEDVIRNSIIDAVMEVAGVYDFTMSAPAANTSIGATQVARTGTFTITFA